MLNAIAHIPEITRWRVKKTTWGAPEAERFGDGEIGLLQELHGLRGGNLSDVAFRATTTLPNLELVRETLMLLRKLGLTAGQTARNITTGSDSGFLDLFRQIVYAIAHKYSARSVKGGDPTSPTKGRT